MIGNVEPLLEFVAAQSSTVDFVDHFRAATEPFDYTWEERWIRDEGLAKIVPPVIEKVLAKAGLAADAVTHFVMPSTIGRAVAGIARRRDCAEAAVRDNLDAVCGETGVAHPLVMLLHTLETMVEAGRYDSRSSDSARAAMRSCCAQRTPCLLCIPMAGSWRLWQTVRKRRTIRNTWRSTI